jgi:hypothetical protein
MRVVLVDPLFELLPYTRCLADALQQAGCRVTQVGADPSPVRGESGAFGGRAPELFPRPRLPVSATLLKGRRYSLLVSQLVHQLRSSQPDVVHFQEQGIPLLDGHLAGLVRRTAALAVTFGSAERLAVRRGSWTRKLACRVDRILTHSEFDRVRLTELGMDRRAIDVLPCGMPMDTRAGPRCMVETAPSNLSHKVPGATLKTVVVRGGGRADPGMRTLIRAVHELPVEIRESCRFVVTDTNRSCAVELQDACREQCVEHLFHFIVGPL